MQYFEAFITSIFLYQCDIWTLPHYLNNKIGFFSALFSQEVVGITYRKNITNKELYNITKPQPWSETNRYRRLTLFGHTCRLPPGAPSKYALQECLKPYNRLVGGQKTTPMDTIQSDFKLESKTTSEAQLIAQDKSEYHRLINSDNVSYHGKSIDTYNGKPSRREDATPTYLPLKFLTNLIQPFATVGP